MTASLYFNQTLDIEALGGHMEKLHCLPAVGCPCHDCPPYFNYTLVQYTSYVHPTILHNPQALSWCGHVVVPGVPWLALLGWILASSLGGGCLGRALASLLGGEPPFRGVSGWVLGIWDLETQGPLKPQVAGLG